MKRGVIRKSESEFIGLWIPKPLVSLIDHGVRKLDTDRSKFIRQAVREKVSREMTAEAIK
jgi:metal-responsive CopG/Arc/MetJ family transcriptional regulator